MDMMSKEEMINLLVKDDLESWYDRDDKDSYFAYIMRKGFKGYEEHTKLDLYLELTDRELLPEIENE